MCNNSTVQKQEKSVEKSCLPCLPTCQVHCCYTDWWTCPQVPGTSQPNLSMLSGCHSNLCALLTIVDCTCTIQNTIVKTVDNFQYFVKLCRIKHCEASHFKAVHLPIAWTAIKLCSGFQNNRTELMDLYQNLKKQVSNAWSFRNALTVTYPVNMSVAISSIIRFNCYSVFPWKYVFTSIQLASMGYRRIQLSLFSFADCKPFSTGYITVLPCTCFKYLWDIAELRL